MVKAEKGGAIERRRERKGEREHDGQGWERENGIESFFFFFHFVVFGWFKLIAVICSPYCLLHSLCSPPSFSFVRPVHLLSINNPSGETGIYKQVYLIK